MKRSCASTEFIQVALGYTNIKTAENYLDNFEKEVKKEFTSRLVSFRDTSVWQYNLPMDLVIENLYCSYESPTLSKVCEFWRVITIHEVCVYPAV